MLFLQLDIHSTNILECNEFVNTIARSCDECESCFSSLALIHSLNFGYQASFI